MASNNIDLAAVASSSSSFVLRIAMLLCLLINLGLVWSSTSCDFPAVFNFGDSNSDTGGLSAAFGPAQPPSGESFFGRPAGRYCDGRLIIDFIAEGLGLSYLSAYLDSIGTNFSQGANYATAASTIRRPNITLFNDGYSPFSLDVQSWQFNQFISRSALAYRKGGIFTELLPKQDLFSKALYTFDIGQNDLTMGLFFNMSVEQVKAYLPDVLDKFSAVIKGTYGLGARSYWIHNTGPLGCLPYVLDRLPIAATQIDEAGCATPYNQVAQFYNKMLKETVAVWRKRFKDASFTYVDVYSAKYELFAHPNKHGFVNPLVSCCGHDGKYNYNRHIGCGDKKIVNGAEILIGKSCVDPSRAVVWDGVHYTQAANKFIYDQIVDGRLSDPPVPLKQSCNTRHYD